MAKNKVKKKTAVKVKKTARKTKKDKMVGKIEHIFDKIGVVTTTLKSALKVGDIVRIKGHTTDLVQAVGSMQIEHESVQKAKKGDGVGIKVKGIIRDNDVILLADKKTAAAFRQGLLSIPLSGNAIPSAHKQIVTMQRTGAAAAAPAVQNQIFQAQKTTRPISRGNPEQPKFFSF